MWRGVDDLVVKAVIAAEPSLFEATSTAVPAVARGEPTRQSFQVFGFDVMLDAGAKPWLLEVNGDPQMTTQSPVDLRVKVLPPGMPSSLARAGRAHLPNTPTIDQDTIIIFPL